MIITVCGFPRAGTTMLYNMLRTTLPDVEFYDSEQSIVNITDSEHHNTCIKRPFDIFNLHNLKDKHTVPIVLVRDIRSILTSYHHSVPNTFFADWNKLFYVPEQGSPYMKTPGLLSVYNEIVKYKMLTIKYEDLITNPQQCQELIQQKIPNTFVGKFEDFYLDTKSTELSKAMNGIRPIDKSRITNWKKHPQRIIEQFTKHPQLFDVLKYFSYEDNNDWFNELKENNNVTI